MPKSKRKIFVTTIICFGLVVAVWLIMQIPVIKPLNLGGNGSVSVETYRNLEGLSTGDDWQKLLSAVDPESQILLQKPADNKNPDIFDETTATAQTARDLFAQYILLKKGGHTLTNEEIASITGNALSPEYTKSAGPIYKASNLNITSKTTKETVQNYKNALDIAVAKFPKDNDEAMFVVSLAVLQGQTNELKKLDSPIKTGKIFVNDLLEMTVPAGIINLHLALLNSSGNVIANLEDMQNILNDPIKGLVAVNSYVDNVYAAVNALKDVAVFIQEKTR